MGLPINMMEELFIPSPSQIRFMAESANRVLQLEQAVEELREALKPFANYACGCGKCHNHNCIADLKLKQTKGLV